MLSAFFVICLWNTKKVITAIAMSISTQLLYLISISISYRHLRNIAINHIIRPAWIRLCLLLTMAMHWGSVHAVFFLFPSDK